MHHGPIEGMNSETAKEMITRMNKVDKRNFIGNKKEVKCPRQSNSYDCGIYVILMIEKIIKNVKEGKSIEDIQISQEEAERKRKSLRDKINEESITTKEIEEKKISGKQAEIKENEEYITKLEGKQLDFKKIDIILLEDKPKKEENDKKSKEKIKKIHKMSVKLIKENRKKEKREEEESKIKITPKGKPNKNKNNRRINNTEENEPVYKNLRSKNKESNIKENTIDIPLL